MVVYEPGPNDWVYTRQPTICCQDDAQVRKYHKYIGKSGRVWLVADQPNSADNIYSEGGPNSQGFGGSTLTFPLVDGTEIKLKGPWHSNDGSFFNDTGVDISDKHLVRVVIGMDVRWGLNYQTIVKDVIHKDEDPVLGIFHRGDVLGREKARELGHRVYVVDMSQGGGSLRFVEPDAKFYWEKDYSPETDPYSIINA